MKYKLLLGLSVVATALLGVAFLIGAVQQSVALPVRIFYLGLGGWFWYIAVKLLRLNLRKA